ncbi:hypothetical protein CLAFUW4_11906 [Fulvia fulva]|nr:hypothetical protein CLAFUR4_11911 [Fulvia fulva]WPV18493.1 hypothetical protein CLAFUW4_11906 [Fulvia fulva]WPV32769.1 hypothetical protein CLAFUW7_11913 [Fulvia fulva]
MEARKKELHALLTIAAQLAEELHDELAIDATYRANLVGKSKILTRTLQTPVDQVADLDFTTFHLPATVTAIRAGWLRALHDAGTAGAHVNQVASKCGADASLVRRVLRFLASIGVVKETGQDTFTSNALCSLICQGAGLSGCLTYSYDVYALTSARMADYFAGNGYREPDNEEAGLCAYALGVPFWQFLNKRPDTAKTFNVFMETARFAKKSWLEVYPVHELSQPDDQSIMLIDVGGGRGHDLVELAMRQQQIGLKGRLVLQERPEVIVQVPAEWENDFEAHEHDFFQAQPEQFHRAAAYYMRYVLHDWPDQQCIIILAHLRDAMEVGRCRLLINEFVLPDVGCANHAASFDMVMLHGFSGKERTRSEWHEFVEVVPGLRIERIFQLEQSGESLIEVRRIR